MAIKENTMLSLNGEDSRQQMAIPEIMKQYKRDKPGSPTETYKQWREARIKEKMERDEYDEELNELVAESNSPD